MTQLTKYYVDLSTLLNNPEVKLSSMNGVITVVVGMKTYSAKVLDDYTDTLTTLIDQIVNEPDPVPNKPRRRSITKG